MYPSVVFANQVRFMGVDVSVLLADQVVPPSTDETKPTSSWQVDVVQFAFG